MGNIRSTHFIDDIQRCIYALLNELASTTSPWTDWTVKLGYPEAEVFDQFDEPIIYVMPPVQINKIRHQGESAPTRYWRMTIGAWLNRMQGGTEEMNIIGSKLMALFEDGATCCSTTTFDVTLGTTAYTNTNLITMGIVCNGIEGPNERFDVVDEKEFRNEWDVELIA